MLCELCYNQDLYLLQIALVVLPPDLVIVSILDCFRLLAHFSGNLWQASFASMFADGVDNDSDHDTAVGDGNESMYDTSGDKGEMILFGTCIVFQEDLNGVVCFLVHYLVHSCFNPYSSVFR